MKQLSLATLDALPPEVRRPRYDLTVTTRGIVHIGVGNFHRAHQAVYTDDALAAGEHDWSITGVSLRSSATRDALTPQDCLYTVIEREGTTTRARVVGALREVLLAPESSRAVIERIADARTRIVTITVTEKGYGHDSATGALNTRHPDIAHDLTEPARPRSLVGLLLAGLDERRARGHGGLTVLSCDNLSHNGRLLARLVGQFAEATGRAGSLRGWITDQVRFPNGMVDRIVPETSTEVRDLAQQLLGMADAWPVATEPFTQWVIEDQFAAGRPQWERSGVQLVSDVAPYEAMKLQLLNAAHSCMAYLGYPAGFKTIPVASAQPAIRQFIVELWRTEIVPTLPASLQSAIPDYCAQLFNRFSNVALGHQTRQIAMDGSQKLPMRLLPPLRAHLHAGRPYPLIALGLAAWIRYLAGRTESAERYSIDDPLADALTAAINAADADPQRMVAAVFAIESIFGADLARNKAVHDAVSQWLRRLLERGTIGTLSAIALP